MTHFIATCIEHYFFLGGIGESICKLLLNLNCYVISVDVQSGKHLGPNFEFRHINLTSLESIKNFVNNVNRPIDYLVNCAGNFV